MSPRVSGTTICCSKNPLQVSFQPPAPRLTPFLQSLQASSKEAKELFLPCKDPLALVRPTVQREDRAEEEETGPLATSSSDNMDPCDDDPVLKPSLMPFDTMCRELQAWRARFGTCHVPRRCFDAAELGAWVRYIRRKYRRRTLETWKADCLNLLSFCWEVSCIAVAVARMRQTRARFIKSSHYHMRRSAARTEDGMPTCTTCVTSRRFTWLKLRHGCKASKASLLLKARQASLRLRRSQWGGLEAQTYSHSTTGFTGRGGSCLNG